MKVYNTEIILKYINKKGKIKILGEEFVDNNKNNCKIIYNGIEKELNSCIINDNESNEIEIKLKIYKDIIDMSKMFSDCKDLKSISDLSKLNTNNVYKRALCLNVVNLYNQFLIYPIGILVMFAI